MQLELYLQIFYIISETWYFFDSLKKEFECNLILSIHIILFNN